MIVWFALGALAACAGERSTGANTDGLNPSFYLTSESTTCGGSGTNNSNNSGVDRTCLTNGNIPLTLTGSGEAALLSAIGAWNDLLKEGTGMPQLQVASSGGIPVTIPSADTAYCGATTPGTGGRVGQVIIYGASSGNCNTKKTGELQPVLRHELAHVLGWNSAHGGLPGSRTSITANCVTFLPAKDSEDEMTSNVCFHDVEALFRAKASGSGWTHDEDYFTSPILWTTNAPTSESIPATTSEQIAMSQWFAKPSGTQNRSHSHLTWSESSALFSVNGTGTVTAGSTEGSGMLYLKATSTPPSGYLIWSPFKDCGDSVTIVVTEAPPPPPFLLDSLIADQQPVIYGGSRTFTAYFSNQPTGSLSTEWWVDDPRTTGVVPDTTFTKSGAQATFFVDGGEYGLEIRVRGKVGSVYSGAGIWSTFFFPVCGTEEAFAECPSM